MKISLNWLTDYVDVAVSAKELARLLTHAGWNCEEIIETPSDIVLDLEVTSNRPDCLGHLGIAREVAAVTGTEFRPPKLGDVPTAGRVEDFARVTVEAPDLCPRYTARLIRGVKVGPSPEWLVERLDAVGLRSINNIVDVTNFVLMEYSQPLHSFDFDKLAGGEIIVRRGRGGEQIVSIDETRCRLSESMLVIADAEKAVAVAGIMGGLNTEVGDSTTNVLIEAAQFDPLVTRRTARALALMSESNYRFERGVDPVALERASYRACQLIIDLAGGKLAEGVLDVWAEPFQAHTVSLRPSRCNALLGFDVTPQRQSEILERLGLAPQSQAEQIVCTIPSFRRDLQREVDLVEEIGRMEGYEKLPASGQVSHAVTDEGQDQRTRRKVGLLLTAAGFDEAISFTFVDSAEAALFGCDDPVHVDLATRKTNSALRPTLFPSLLRACKTNQDAGNTHVSLFELGSVFPPRPGAGELPAERVELAMVTTRDTRDLRGVVETLVERVAPAAKLDIRPGEQAGLAKGQMADIYVDGQAVGAIGRVSPEAQDYYDLGREISAARIDLAVLIEHSQHQVTYAPLAKFPSVSRDLSVVVDEAVTWDRIEQAVAAVDQPMRRSLEYITTFRGKQIPRGQKSISMRLVYRRQEGTLRSEEVDEQMAQVVALLAESLSAELRA